MYFQRKATVLYLCLLFAKVSSYEYVESQNGDEDYEYEGVVCLVGEFKCVVHEICIWETMRCDGNLFDCPDNSDEANCTIEATTQSAKPTATTDDYRYETSPCLESEIDCDGQICVDKTKLCNGVPDCPNGKDEFNCSTPTTTSVAGFSEYESCSGGEFDCGDNECFPIRILCDGVYDCVDGKDERNCSMSTTTASLPIFPDYEDCDAIEFDCGEGECYPITVLCDGVRDCMNGRDEINCSTDSPTSVTATTPQSQEACSKVDHFICNDGACFPLSVRCDGIQNCSDGSDELDCHIDLKGKETETTSTSWISTVPVKQSEMLTSASTARPPLQKIECFYKNAYYRAGAKILQNNCKEVSCSTSGRLLEWRNEDPRCSGIMIKPAITLLWAVIISVMISWLR